MNLIFSVTNTTTSDVELKVNGQIIESHFVQSGEEVKFTIPGELVIDGNVITIENSDMIYDITDQCRTRLAASEKPIVKYGEITPTRKISSDPFMED